MWVYDFVWICDTHDSHEDHKTKCDSFFAISLLSLVIGVHQMSSSQWHQGALGGTRQPILRPRKGIRRGLI